MIDYQLWIELLLVFVMFCEILRMYACMPLLNRVGLVWVHCRLLRIQGYNIMDSILIKVGKTTQRYQVDF